jgi:phosphatidylinositol-4-phosphate 3-kinase
MDSKPTFVFRRFGHFQELHSKLVELYPEVNLPRLPARIFFRSQIRTVAERRRAELDDYLRHLLMMPREISESDVLYTFLHSLLLDEEEASKFSIHLLPEEKASRAVTGQIKLSLRFERDALRVMVMHAKDLSPRGTSGLADPYVKLYLLPDPDKVTKIKTMIAKRYDILRIDRLIHIYRGY